MGIFGLFDARPAPARTRPSRRARLRLEALEAREVPFASTGNVWLHPELITIGFVPDGTIVSADENGYVYSTLFADLNARFGSASVWQNEVLRAAQVWAQETNLNFALVADNGAEIGTGDYQQGDPWMADIRIGGFDFGTTALAQGYLPPEVNNYSVAGDVQFNTSRPWNVGTTYDLFTVSLHEIGHALGLNHSGIYTTVMYANYTGTKTGLSGDDVSGIRSVYSTGGARANDAYDATANDSFATASDVTALIDPSTTTALVEGLDVTTTADVDFFTFTAPADHTGVLSVAVQSSGLSLLAPSVTVFAADQTTVLGSASAAGQYGATVTVSVAGVTTGQRFYVKVDGADNSAFGTGAFALGLSFGPGPVPTASSPDTATLNGDLISGGGGEPVVLFDELRVNGTTANVQQTFADSGRSAAIDPYGNFVVVWSGQGQDGDPTGKHNVYAQRYNSTGQALGSAILVNVNTAGDQRSPSVAVDSAGNFVVTWSTKSTDTSGDTYGVRARRFSAAGVALTGELSVNTTSAGEQDYTSVASDAAGNFVATWSSQNQDGSGWGVYARRYSAAGAALSGEFLVNVYTNSDQKYSAAAMDADGDFVIVWTEKYSDTDWDVYGRRFDKNGVAQGGEFVVTNSAYNEQDVAVAMDSAGNFVVTWSRLNQDGSGWGVYAQRFSASGVALGSAFRVNGTTAGDQLDSSVTRAANGDFLVTWASNGQDGSGWGVYARQFEADGTALDGEFRVNTTTSGDQTSATAAINNSGRAVVVWSGNVPGDSSGVAAQLYDLRGGTGAGGSLQALLGLVPRSRGVGVSDHGDHDPEPLHVYAPEGDPNGCGCGLCTSLGLANVPAAAAPAVAEAAPSPLVVMSLPGRPAVVQEAQPGVVPPEAVVRLEVVAPVPATSARADAAPVPNAAPGATARAAALVAAPVGGAESIVTVESAHNVGDAGAEREGPAADTPAAETTEESVATFAGLASSAELGTSKTHDVCFAESEWMGDVVSGSFALAGLREVAGRTDATPAAAAMSALALVGGLGASPFRVQPAADRVRSHRKPAPVY